MSLSIQEERILKKNKMPGTAGGRGCPGRRGWSAAASAVADTETKAPFREPPGAPVPRASRGRSGGRGQARGSRQRQEGKGRAARQEGKEGRAAAAAAPLSTRHGGPGRPRRASFAARCPAIPAGRAQADAGGPRGRRGRRPGSGVNPEAAHPLRQSRLPPSRPYGITARSEGPFYAGRR